MTQNNGSSLRFGTLIRVSTERQEEQGESLNIQRNTINRSVEQLGGTIVASYGGQEHATPGWEHGEVDRLLADAATGRFNAVMVAFLSRWSRDNAKSKEGLEVLRDHKIKFFSGPTELDLFKPADRLYLGLMGEIGEFQALEQALLSLETRIERAKRGKPTCGWQRPFGRSYDKDSNTWSIVDPENWTTS